MRKIFISYGDKKFKNSLKRIGRNAKSLKIFDQVKLYSESDLPLYIKSSPAFAFNRGGGYWIWKPYIIYTELQKMNIGDILVYADAGCLLNQTNEWDEYFQYLKKYNSIFFQYKENIDYGWKDIEYVKYDSPKIKHWLKDSSIEYFSKYFEDDKWLDYNKILGGSFLIKKTKENIIIDEWYKLVLFRPDLIVDAFGIDKYIGNHNLNEHRHDQALLTILVYLYTESNNLLIIPENLELESSKNSPIFAARLNNSESLFFRFKKKAIRCLRYFLFFK